MQIPQRLLTLSPEVKSKIETRLAEFEKKHKEGNKEWFSELCFCILTANSKAKTALKIESIMAPDGYLNIPQDDIAKIIRGVGHRFHNNKARFIVEARKFKNIKDILTSFKTSAEARDFLVKNIKGLGFKEASHFLRNVGYHDVAIIDRHILRFLYQEKFITEIPKTITPKIYLKYEQILSKFEISQDKLDLLIWASMTGEVLK